MQIFKKNKIFIGNQLKKLRKLKDLTTEQLSNDINVDVRVLNNYEQNNNEPYLQNLINISIFFEISLDFLICWNMTDYPHNLKLIRLAEKIDKMNQTERYQIESTARTLLKNDSITDNFKHKVDSVSLCLTDNINDNIRTFFDNKVKTQKEVAGILGIKESVVSFYKTKTTPPADKLIKLSEIFNISIHALATGRKLNFDFENKGMEKTIFIADKFLSLEDQKFLIKLMENIINEQK